MDNKRFRVTFEFNGSSDALGSLQNALTDATYYGYTIHNVEIASDTFVSTVVVDLREGRNLARIAHIVNVVQSATLASIPVLA